MQTFGSSNAGCKGKRSPYFEGKPLVSVVLIGISCRGTVEGHGSAFVCAFVVLDNAEFFKCFGVRVV